MFLSLKLCCDELSDQCMHTTQRQCHAFTQLHKHWTRALNCEAYSMCVLFSTNRVCANTVMHSIQRFGIGRSELTKPHPDIWLSANCVETTGNTDEILSIFHLRATHLSNKARLTGDYLQVATEV